MQNYTPLINRVEGPVINEVKASKFPDYEKIHLPNGMDLYVINAGTQEIFKLELVFHGGRRYEAKSGVGRVCASMTREGFGEKSSEELSEFWDFYGANIMSYSDLDTSGASITCLTRHYESLLPNFFSIVNEASFSEEELSNKKKIFAEKLKRELSKNDVIGYRELTSAIYGKHHSYGYNTSPDDYAEITRDDLVEHYKKFWGAGRGYAVLSGKITTELKQAVIDHLKGLRKATEVYVKPGLMDQHSFPKPEIYKFPTPNKMQAAIKIGGVTIHRNNPDYTAFYLLVQILGGYFGSRLMKNLREEKGLCYNIYASIDRLKSSNYFYISAEIDSDKLEESMEEIQKEIDTLKREPISEDELTMVKNYVNGKILAGLDGPFRSSQLIKSYLSHELDFDYFCHFTDSLAEIDANLLMEMANKYLKWDELTQVIVGP